MNEAINLEQFLSGYIGTEYGHIHTTSGDVRTWNSYSGAYKFLCKYQSV